MVMKIKFSIQDRITHKIQKIYDALPDFLKKPDPYLQVDPNWLTGMKSGYTVKYLHGNDGNCIDLVRRRNHALYYGLKGYHRYQENPFDRWSWLAWDNSNGDCKLEIFNKEENCIRWLNGQDLKELQD